jgi:hypothetical protein
MVGNPALSDLMDQSYGDASERLEAALFGASVVSDSRSASK